MRKSFIETIVKVSKYNKNIYLLTADVGYSVLEPFKDLYPDRFINVGVAEQNLIGIAAGLALEGKIVYAYSMAQFITLRCLEQIRNDLCYQNLNVRLVGTGGGVHYGTAGATHYALEDLSVMRSLVNMTVVVPADPLETELVIKKSVSYNGPMYIRLGKNLGNIHNKISINNFEIGKGIILKDGKDISILATGNMLFYGKKVVDYLEQKGISAGLISIHTIKPLDFSLVKKLINTKKAIFTLEEHSITGGLGSALSEIIAESNKKVLFKRYALPDKYIKVIGSQEYILRRNNLSAEQISRDIINCLKRKSIIYEK